MSKSVIEINTDIIDFDIPSNEKDIRDYVSRVLAREYPSEKPVYLSLLLTSDEAIRVINREYRDKDAPTDVISFAYHETGDFDVGPYDTLGDIVVSLERVAAQAADYGHSEKRELYYVITHGILHLLGYDHMTEDDKKRMREKEEELLGAFGYTRDEPAEGMKKA